LQFSGEKILEFLSSGSNFKLFFNFCQGAQIFNYFFLCLFWNKIVYNMCNLWLQKSKTKIFSLSSFLLLLDPGSGMENIRVRDTKHGTWEQQNLQ
jgi:hypothetical protein